ncbi:hypothetical protein G6F62_004435 [Rhizopus arrhizus]|nr:hypothetical protein G6F62_004435 [Rhizopus arrhizus]
MSSNGTECCTVEVDVILAVAFVVGGKGLTSSFTCEAIYSSIVTIPSFSSSSRGAVTGCYSQDFMLKSCLIVGFNEVMTESFSFADRLSCLQVLNTLWNLK